MIPVVSTVAAFWYGTRKVLFFSSSFPLVFFFTSFVFFSFFLFFPFSLFSFFFPSLPRNQGALSRSPTSFSVSGRSLCVWRRADVYFLLFFLFFIYTGIIFYMEFGRKGRCIPVRTAVLLFFAAGLFIRKSSSVNLLPAVFIDRSPLLYNRVYYQRLSVIAHERREASRKDGRAT